MAEIRRIHLQSSAEIFGLIEPILNSLCKSSSKEFLLT